MLWLLWQSKELLRSISSLLSTTYHGSMILLAEYKLDIDNRSHSSDPSVEATVYSITSRVFAGEACPQPIALPMRPNIPNLMSWATTWAERGRLGGTTFSGYSMYDPRFGMTAGVSGRLA